MSINSTEKSQDRRPRVLHMSYCCSPYQGSEPGVGWNRAIESAKSCDTWVICEDIDFGTEVRHYLQANGPVENLHFVYVPRLKIEKYVRRIPSLFYACYNIWQRRAIRAAKKLHSEVQFDLAQQVSLMGYREPGYLRELGIPWIWGPWGGTQSVPLRFLKTMGLKTAIQEGTRGVVNYLQLRLAPRIRRAFREATVTVVANSQVQKDVADVYHYQPLVIAGNGITELAPPDAVVKDGKANCLRILWGGRLEAMKALPLLFQALAQLPEGLNYELEIMGRGPMKDKWVRLAQQLGIDRHVRWLPYLEHCEVMQRFIAADVFAFTSMRETVPTVILEAIAAGTPVVCLDHQGVSDLVPDGCGIRVPVRTPDQVSADLAQAITKLASSPELRKSMGQAAYQHAHKFLWKNQCHAIYGVYRQVLDKVVFPQVNMQMVEPEVQVHRVSEKVRTA